MEKTRTLQEEVRLRDTLICTFLAMQSVDVLKDKTKEEQDRVMKFLENGAKGGVLDVYGEGKDFLRIVEGAAKAALLASTETGVLTPEDLGKATDSGPSRPKWD